MDKKFKIYDMFSQTYDHNEAMKITKYLYDRVPLDKRQDSEFEIPYPSIELKVQEKVSDIDLYTIIERKHGDKNALIFLNGIESLIPKDRTEYHNSGMQKYATKKDIESLKIQLISTKVSIKESIESFKNEIIRGVIFINLSLILIVLFIIYIQKYSL